MLARIAARRAPALRSALAVPSRGYASPGRSDGSVADSKGFSKKEKAVEDQYARTHEAAQLKKIREQIEQKEKELNELKKKAEDESKSA